MKIVSSIEEEPVIEKILRHCKLWIEESPRPPPGKDNATPVTETEPFYDYSYRDFIKAMAVRFIERYGQDEVRSWLIETRNESREYS